MLNRYRVCGTVTVDVYVEIEAKSLEDAIEYAEENFEMTEYANGSLGVEDGNWEFDDGEVTCGDYIRWHEEYSTLEEENVREEEDEEEDEEESED